MKKVSLLAIAMLALTGLNAATQQEISKFENNNRHDWRHARVTAGRFVNVTSNSRAKLEVTDGQQYARVSNGMGNQKGILISKQAPLHTRIEVQNTSPEGQRSFSMYVVAPYDTI